MIEHFRKQINDLIMTDEQIITQIRECHAANKIMNVSLMERGLKILMRHYDQQSQLTTGLEPLTERQADVYYFIKAHIEQHGYSPSIRAIAKATFKSPSVTFGMVEQLIKKKYVDRPSKNALRIIGKRESENH